MAATHNVLRGNIRAELARQGLRQEDLAKALGITQAAVSLKLRAERPITDDEVLKIATRLGVEPGDLFRPSPAPRPKASA